MISEESILEFWGNFQAKDLEEYYWWWGIVTICQQHSEYLIQKEKRREYPWYRKYSVCRGLKKTDLVFEEMEKFERLREE